ncbi:MAG: MFS transporter [Ktedonobacterales bacterium]|nr:MFS transporter [Ktedonobacterales bacterium]
MSANQRFKSAKSPFMMYWSGQTLSNLGGAFTMFALPLLVYKLTGSALSLSLTFVAYDLPYVLFGLLIGAWVDRVNRKRLMILTDAARAGILCVLPVLAMAHLLAVWHIYLAAFLLSTLSYAFNTAEFAAVPSLVGADELLRANGRIQASFSATAVVGPLLAGVLIFILPLSALLFVDAASFGVSLVTLALIRVSFNQTTDAAPANLGQAIQEGVRYVVGHPVLRNVCIMMALINVFATVANTQLVFFAKARYHASDAQVAWLFAAGGVGAVIFALLAEVLRKRWAFSRVALGAIFLFGVGTVLLASAPWFGVALVWWAGISGLGVLFNINFTSLWQGIVPNQLLGRVLSVATVLAWAANPVGSFMGGVAIERTQNVALVYGVSGILISLIAVGFMFSSIAHAERYLMPEQAEVPVPSAVG